MPGPHLEPISEGGDGATGVPRSDEEPPAGAVARASQESTESEESKESKESPQSKEESGPVKKPGPAKKRAERASRPRPPKRPGRSVVVYRARSANTWRFVRAYTTTFQVIFSYLWLFWKAKLL